MKKLSALDLYFGSSSENVGFKMSESSDNAVCFKMGLVNNAEIDGPRIVLLMSLRQTRELKQTYSVLVTI